MAFCTSCGKEIENGSLFCEHCGAKQEDPAPPSIPVPPSKVAPSKPATPTVASPPRRPMSKGAKIGIFVMVLLVAAAAAAVVVLGKLHAPEKTIRTFINAIVAQDYAEFRQVTEAGSDSLNLTEEMVAPFFALESTSKSALEQYQTVLQSDLAQLERGMAATGNGFIRLVEHDHVLYKSYAVEVSGVSFTFTAPLDDTKVTLTPAASGLKSGAVDSSITLDLPKGDESARLTLLPGRYDITATCTGGPLNETFTGTLTDHVLSQNERDCYIEMEYTTIVVEKPSVPLSGLTVNGVPVSSLNFDANNQLYLSPLPKEVEILALFDVNGVQMSDNFVCYEYTWDWFYPQAPRSSMSTQTPVIVPGRDNTYIYPGDSQYITQADLEMLSKHEIMLLRNEFFARHGCTFNEASIRSYFESKSWYVPQEGLNAANFDTAVFNVYEKANVDAILQYERDMGWRN